MESVSIILSLILVVLVLIAIASFMFLKKKGAGGGLDQIAVLMEKLSQLEKHNELMRNELDKKLEQTHRANQDQQGQIMKTVQGITGQSAKLITDVTEKLTKLDETNKQVVNFSAQLQNLQDILKNPKQRGVLGEYYLEETLKNVLPPNSYQMQYGFKDGTIVDAIVRVKDKIIPIDSKFSLENYERIINTSDKEVRDKYAKLFKADLKIRIDETSKYVKPGEGTMDFAFMFIPSESIYYDLLVSKVGGVNVNSRDLIDYAFKDKHVIIVSPTSFLAYLQTVLQGLRALQIEESAKEIRANVEKLGKHILSYEDFMKKLGVSMGTTVNHYNNAYKELKKIDKDVVRITGDKSEMDPVVIDRPKEE